MKKKLKAGMRVKVMPNKDRYYGSRVVGRIGHIKRIAHEGTVAVRAVIVLRCGTSIIVHPDSLCEVKK